MYTVILSTLVVLFIAIGCFYDLRCSKFANQRYAFSFRVQRFLVWFPLGLAYAGFYAARYGFMAGNTPTVRARIGFTSADFGTVLTAGFWVYAATAPFMGVVASKIGERSAIILSAVVCGLTNGLLGLYVSLSSPPLVGVVALLYSLSMMFQALGTSTIPTVTSAWYRKEEIGHFSGVFNVMVNSGYFLALGVCPSFVREFGFPAVFFLPTTLLLAMAVAMWCCLKSEPNKNKKTTRSLQEIKSSSSEEEKENRIVVAEAEVDVDVEGDWARQHSKMEAKTELEPDNVLGKRHRLSKMENNTKRRKAKLDRRSLIGSTFVTYVLAIASLCWVKDGLLSWCYLFLKSARYGDESGVEGLSADTTSLLGFAITLGGFTGGIALNIVAEQIFNGKRSTALFMFSILQFLSLTLFWFASVGNMPDYVVALFLFLTTTFMLGSYSALSFLVPTDLPPSVISIGAGIMTSAGYVASGCSGVFFGTALTGVESGVPAFYPWIISLCVATTFTAICSGVVRSNSGKTGSGSARRFSSVRSFAGSEVAESNETILPIPISGDSSKSDERIDRVRSPRRYSTTLEALVQPEKTMGTCSGGFLYQTHSITAVRTAGIADEFLRSRMEFVETHNGGNDASYVGTKKNQQETVFFQWPGRSTTPRERLEWRIQGNNRSQSSRRNELGSTSETRAFLNNRRNDPTSYFGNTSLSSGDERISLANVFMGGGGGLVLKL
jgi:sugar phosphate permease